jgi:hypothetical protein
MSVDKLILLCPTVDPDFIELVMKEGLPKGKFKKCLDLRGTTHRLPVRLSCDGAYNKNKKVEFFDVAQLGLAYVEDTVRTICGSFTGVTVCRVDVCVDLLNLSPWDLAAACEVPGAKVSMFYRNSSGDSFYPQVSHDKTVLFYDKLRLARSRHDPFAKMFKFDDCMCRVELQFRGRGVAIKEFSNIRGYGEIDLLRGINFLDFLQLKVELTPNQRLTALGFQFLVRQMGLQNALRQFSSFDRAKYFVSAANQPVPNIRSLLQKGVRNWLEDRIRFPRI